MTDHEETILKLRAQLASLEHENEILRAEAKGAEATFYRMGEKYSQAKEEIVALRLENKALQEGRR